MEGIHKYLYAISAACFIGVGSALVTLTPYLIDYEAQAMKLGYELEQVTNSDYSKGIDCSEFPDIYAKCQYTKHLITSNTVHVGFFTDLAYFLIIIGSISIITGVYFHPSKQ